MRLICYLLTEHLAKSNPDVRAARQLVQNKEESIDLFAVTLRSKAANCHFAASDTVHTRYRLMALIGQFVCRWMRVSFATKKAGHML